MARVVILGGGFGGAAADRHARSVLSDGHEIVVVDRATDSFLCGVNPAVIVGEAEPVSRSIASLAGGGVQYLRGDVERIDLETRTVATSAGDEPWDFLVVALGVRYDWDAVPGSAVAYSFYDRQTSLRLRDRLAEFGGGSIVIGIGGSPYRCPPAPFEAALMIDGFLRRRGLRPDSSITVAIPEPQPLGVAGPAATARMRGILEDANITLHTATTLRSVAGGSMVFEDGTVLQADVPITIPVHRLQPSVDATGLAGGKPFLPVDRSTLETSAPNVFAVGDTNGIPIGEKAGIPKAGVFAAGQGHHAAAVIAARVGDAPDPGPYDGRGHCFLMFGSESGSTVGGDFFAANGPDVALDEPSAAGRRAKDEWEAAWARFEI